MKMLVTAVGVVAPPIRVNKRKRQATFTIKVDNDRFFITTVGLEHYERMKEFAENKESPKVMVLGHAFSYRSRKCGTHHVGIQPIILVPFEDYSEVLAMQDIVSQWFLASLLSLNRPETAAKAPNGQ